MFEDGSKVCDGKLDKEMVVFRGAHAAVSPWQRLPVLVQLW
jgi:hypothetical protein